MRVGYNKKLTLEYVKSFIENEGYTLLSKEYLNAAIKLTLLCPNGHIYKVTWNNFSRKNGSRCPICWNKYNKGKHHWAHKNKLNGIPHPNSGPSHPLYDIKGKYNPNYGKKYPNLSEQLRGSKNPNWRGGLSYEPYCELWKDQDYKNFIIERDSNKCLGAECDRKNKSLVVHHINYNKKQCNKENLITLCISCNSKANKDRKWHECWYTAVLKNRYGY